MRLRKPCEHGRYEQHGYKRLINGSLGPQCPGGEFLPEDALGELVYELATASNWSVEDVRRALATVLDTFAADQVGEQG